MNNVDSLMAGPVGVMIGFFLLIWAILMFFSPFFWYGTNRRTKEISQKMDKLIELAKDKNTNAS
ncbi:hypothetical protein [Haliea sp. E17]|uniref:hypothetical protein n=1 Tax=Haliea sp. E17 TaxID=3401576 RepID=UPI003AAD315E